MLIFLKKINNFTEINDRKNLSSVFKSLKSTIGHFAWFYVMNSIEHYLTSSTLTSNLNLCVSMLTQGDSNEL